MSGKVSLRSALGEAAAFSAQAWRRAPIGCGLILLSLLVPTFVGERAVSLWLALPLALAQAVAALAGWTSVLRAAMASPSDPAAAGRDAARLLGSVSLNALFLCLIVVILGLVLLGVAGATGLAPGEDLAMATAASVTQSGWRTFVLLALEIASVLLLLTLFARLSVAGPATLSEQRVVSLQALGLTRGSGMKPALGLVTVLTPLWLLALSGLLAPVEAAWIDWVWAGVLAFIQAPLLAGYSVGLWRSATSGEPS